MYCEDILCCNYLHLILGKYFIVSSKLLGASINFISKHLIIGVWNDHIATSAVAGCECDTFFVYVVTNILSEVFFRNLFEDDVMKLMTR